MGGKGNTKSRWWKIGLLLILSPCFASVLVVWWANFSAKRDWEKHKAELEAQGESLDWRDFISEPLADEDNLAMAPIMEKNLRVLDPMKSLPGMKSPKGFRRWEFAEAYPFDRIYRPEGRNEFASEAEALASFEAFYESHAEDYEAQLAATQLTGLTSLTRNSQKPDNPHSSERHQLSKNLSMMALYHIRRGQANPSLDILLGLLRLWSPDFDSYESLISNFIRVATIHHGLQSTWEGLGSRLWDDAQLQRVDSALASHDLVKGLARSLRCERAESARSYIESLANPELTAASLESLGDDEMRIASWYVRLAPKAFLYRNATAQSILTTQQISIAEQSTSVLNKKALEDLEHYLEARATAFLGMPNPSEHLALETLTLSNRMIRSSLQTATLLDLARIAVALERHHLAEGTYPPSLDDLSPRFMATIPHDRMNGDSLCYRLKPDGTPQIYSVGLNGIDEQGTVTRGRTEGDLVWQYTYPHESP